MVLPRTRSRHWSGCGVCSGLHECLGPIGMHVKLKPEFQKWAGAVQSVAAFFWSKFLGACRGVCVCILCAVCCVLCVVVWVSADCGATPVRSRDLAKYNALSRKLRVRINFIVYNRDNTKCVLAPWCMPHASVSSRRGPHVF